jgi:bisanhydrobacterioruberin hydratase
MVVTFWNAYKQWVLLAIIVIFHTVGFVGLQSTSREYFLSLSPLNLLLSFSCLVLSFQHFTRRLFLAILVVGVVGFSAEYIGVHTQLLFGNYLYGKNLGLKLVEIPLVIAVNWAMLSFSALAIVFSLRVPLVVKALLSAALMTFLDVLIEPVAITSDFWSWEDGIIPMYNYVCWFVLSFLLHFWLLKRGVVEQNTVGIGLYVVLVLFFGLLNF